MLRRFFTTGVLALAFQIISFAGIIKGTVTEAGTKEPLIGAAVIIRESGSGTITDPQGQYQMEIKEGEYDLLFSYIGFKDIVMEKVKIGKETVLNIEMQVNEEILQESGITARKTLEGDRILAVERMNSNKPIENLGAKELSLKGIGDVGEGVKKMTGISIGSAGQVTVRGLGDRYSITTLNGLPIASPNPDNKLIPLNLFPSAIVEHINVSKVYSADAYADYSGAHIDICTKSNVPEDFFEVSVKTGGSFNCIFGDFFQMDRQYSLFGSPHIDPAALNLDLKEFDKYVKSNNIFGNGFNVRQTTARPDLGGVVSAGKMFSLGKHELDLIASFTIDNGLSKYNDAYTRTLEATGNIQNDFNYKQYTESLDISGMAGIRFHISDKGSVGYRFLLARNVSDEYELRDGHDSEGHNLTGSNNVTHIYRLMNHHIDGVHFIGKRFEIGWNGSYSTTASKEPDRRQVMFLKGDDGNLSLFKLNRQETMRYFGNLEENEWNASVNAIYKWKESNVKVGFDFKDKSRDYAGTRFYYNLNRLNPVIDNAFETDSFLNQDNISNGTIIIDRKKQPKDSYMAGTRIYAAYAQTDLKISEWFLLNLGLRYEHSSQSVKYASDGGDLYSRQRTLKNNEFFPAVNMKFTTAQNQFIRLSASRTVTRPSFVEMAPFLYQESYGSAQIRGNENLQNGYNYNIDVRYELFGKASDMLSATAYFKYLDSPIERIQELNGGATLHSFQNADDGIAAGVEVEARKQIVRDLTAGANFSYMYTNVKLAENGAYTNKSRALQGASPILLNADIIYNPKFRRSSALEMSLTYNLQGKRIHAVGVSG